MKTIQTIYMVAQIIFAFLLIIFGLANLIRCMADSSGIFHYLLFSIMTCAAYRLMFIPSIKELKEFLIKK